MPKSNIQKAYEKNLEDMINEINFDRKNGAYVVKQKDIHIYVHFLLDEIAKIKTYMEFHAKLSENKTKGERNAKHTGKN